MSLSTRFEGFEDPSDRADDDADGTASCNIFRISSEDNGNRVLEPLNKAARNQIARRDPTVALAAIAHARARLANQEGFLKKEDWVVSWEAAFISHHLQFTVKCTQGEFRHLASVTNRAIKDPVSNEFRIVLVQTNTARPSMHEILWHLPMRFWLNHLCASNPHTSL